MRKVLLRLLASVVGMLTSCSVLATDVVLNPDHPDEYVVKKGDTLWDISETFLATPWLWPKVWQANPQVDNPHLIYPGDRLRLVFIDGQPRLVKRKVVKLSPAMRKIEPVKPITTLPLSVIEPFLKRVQVLSPDTIDQLPFILGGNEGNKVAFAGQVLFAKDDQGGLTGLYGVYHPEAMFVDPDTQEVLGINAPLVAIVEATPDGDVTRVKVRKSTMEIRQGDKLLPISQSETLNAYFMPSIHSELIAGRILHNYSNGRYFGGGEIIVINKGAADSVKPGHLLNIYHSGKEVTTDPDHPVFLEDTGAFFVLKDMVTDSAVLTLPKQHIGQAMVFRTFDRVSYALVTKAYKQMANLDIVSTP